MPSSTSVAQQSGVAPLQSAGPLHWIVSLLGHEAAQYAVSFVRSAQHVSPLAHGTVGQLLPASPPLLLPLLDPLLPPELPPEPPPLDPLDPPLDPLLLPAPELLPEPELPLEASAPPEPLPLLPPLPPLDELLPPEPLPDPLPLDVPPPPLLHPAHERVPTMKQATPRESDR
jgi:hypothetical protein